MKLLGIEPTPSPHTMKLILNDTLPMGKNYNYTKEKADGAPDLIKELLNIEGVKGMYHVADFIALERHPKSDWETVLSKVRSVMGAGEESAQNTENQVLNEGYGETRVFIQMFRQIPMQVKLEVDGEEKRVGLPERFMNAIMEAQSASDNMIMERKWVEQSPRYGEARDIEMDVAEEISAAYDEDRLNELVKQAFSKEKVYEESAPFKKVTIDMLDDPDWRKRYAALDRMDPSLGDLPVLEKALHDEKVAIRRLAVVYLGMLEDPKVLPHLYEGLHDRTVTVRRTAGDCLSDLGDPSAVPEMIKALKDSSRIVRWRAAMFLYEVGNETAVPALKEAENDPEFEVAMQIKMALSRIEGGEDAKGSVWRQMTESRK
ncbi:HEAT repeat protein [Scopulibacillus darangshiensis]|uniref:HEAT repeat protein n=1 Tax=Scopulibacillus darangshiensis TaxID=442528 RepID=A0A4R2NRG0_9BACL|nr:conserved virulence factor C family protein [Scopulibacillus darangshiensis]TCP24519.1 HEAT repeat protein [Scopulibacillus darangshiensis]